MVEKVSGARQRLAEVVSSVVEPSPVMVVWDNGYVGWHQQMSLFDQVELCRDCRGSSWAGRRGFESSPPMSLGVVQWLAGVDEQLGRWRCLHVPDVGVGASREDVLFGLALRQWGPDDVGLVGEMVDVVTRWRMEALEFTRPSVRVDLRGAECPVCGARVVRERDGGERVMRPALVVGEDGCVCRACGEVWGPDRLLLLGRVLANGQVAYGVLP